MPGRLLILFFGVLCAAPGFGQRTYNTMAQDTIITRRNFISNTYLLDGKRLNLQVMEFFMKDHPVSNSQIRSAILTDQLAVAGYTVGGLFLLGGTLFRETDPSTSRDLFLYGGISVGAGIILQIISGNYRKNAVRNYNEDIKEYYRNKTTGVRIEIGGNGVGVWF